MARGRGVTLHGAAAGAFVKALVGRVAETEDDKLLRIATFVHLHMKERNEAAAMLILRTVVRDGLDAAAEMMRTPREGEGAAP